MKNVTQTTQPFGNNKTRVCTLVDGELLYEAVVPRREVEATKSEQSDAAHEAIFWDERREIRMESGYSGY